MSVHRNAALTLVKRRQLVGAIATGSSLAAAAACFGVSLRTTRRWWRRWQQEPKGGLQDRSCRPRRMPRAACAALRQQVIGLRRQRLSVRTIAQQVGLSKSTVARIVHAAGLGRLRALQPAEPPNRYEHPHPGDMLHVDIKKLARFQTPGHRATGDRSAGRSQGAGYDYLFVAVDDHTRLAFVGVYPDETGHSASDFLDRLLQSLQRNGVAIRCVLTDNARCFSSTPTAQVYARYQVRHRTTRPYRPRTNGKAERFIQTLLREWAYAQTYTCTEHRTRCLLPWLQWYNEHRPHTSLAGLTPLQRLTNVLGLDS